MKTGRVNSGLGHTEVTGWGNEEAKPEVRRGVGFWKQRCKKATRREGQRRRKSKAERKSG